MYILYFMYVLYVYLLCVHVHATIPVEFMLSLVYQSLTPIQLLTQLLCLLQFLFVHYSDLLCVSTMNDILL